jgi:hypothetical protein
VNPLVMVRDTPVARRLPALSDAPVARRLPPLPDAPAAAPVTWSSRPCADADQEAVLELFTEPDFFYRTAHPDTRPQWEILELIDADTRLLFADGALTGLYTAEPVGSEHSGHLQLHLRLRASAPEALWAAAYGQVVRALRWSGDVVRLSMQIGEFDERGLRAARAIGLTPEGTLGNLCVRGGRRHGFVFFSQIWEPSCD